MKYLCFLFLSVFTTPLLSQTSLMNRQYIFRVYLRDKGAMNYTVENPREFLSQDAIERKMRQKVNIDSSDFPISPDYFHQIEQYNGQVVAYSKWFKTIAVKLNDSLQIGNIAALPFVDSVKYVWRGRLNTDIPYTRSRLGMPDCDEVEGSDNLFGITADEFKLHNAQSMIQAGFRGKGMNVAVIDAGFSNIDVIPYFDKSDIVGSKNFVPTGHLLSANDHGTKVFSAMGVNRPGIMMGSAAEASYLLLRSEDVRSEFPVEEDYWVRAVEYADSAGIDLINSSLGYYNFDDKSLNYAHFHLSGRASLMSLAANKAFDKGMIVVCSAGNEGSKPWRKITPPSDAENVLTVGAIGLDSIIASFSSQGPTADSRIKPDVVSIGKNTISIGRNGLLRTANGTSLSAPFLAGLITSLWSINPGLERSQVIDIVKRSSDRFLKPDTVYGNGIPDFQKAMREILFTLPIHQKQVEDSFCNILPVEDGYVIKLRNPVLSSGIYSVKSIDETGNILSDATFDGQNDLVVSLSKEQRKNRKFLFFVLQNPSGQQVYRIKQ